MKVLRTNLPIKFKKMYQLNLYNEVVFSVKNLAEAAKVYTELLGWQICWEGSGDASQTKFWGLPSNCSTNEMLLQFQGLEYGQIRLIQFNDIPQKIIRAGGQPFDTGGIMDIDLRVSDIGWVYDEMTERGWQPYNPQPVVQTMGPFTVHEVLFRGPDGIVIAFVHRTHPPHPNPFNLTGGTSHVYLSALIVKDLTIANDFFINKLGFLLHNDIAFLGDRGRSIFNLPHNIAAQTNAKLQIIGPTDSREAMFDLIELEGIEGEDFATLAQPPNRGILMYRFPVDNVAAYSQFVQANGVVLRCPLQTIHHSQHDTIQQFAVQSPDGVWLEFWEKV
jgi:catechol 2,3-dioxygenase-like lactoylglutathione lyase family enzyme